MGEEKEKKVPDELSIEEFMELSEEKPPRGKISEDDLIEYLSGTAKTTGAIRKKFGVTYSAMHSRLQRLLDDGKVERRYKEGKAFWTVKEA